MISVLCYGWLVNLSQVFRLAMITISLNNDLWKAMDDVTRPG
jgi:hypothetical protein